MVDDFGVLRTSLAELLSKCSPLFFPFFLQFRFILMGFCQKHLRIHVVSSLVAREKYRDLAEIVRYVRLGMSHEYFPILHSLSIPKDLNTNSII